MELPLIVTWVCRFVQLVDPRRAVALAHAVWGLIKGGVVSFAAIGRPRSGRRDHSLRNIGTYCMGDFVSSIDRMIATHLRRALLDAPYTVGQSRRDPRVRLQLKFLALTKQDLPPLARKCRRRYKGRATKVAVPTYGSSSCAAGRWEIRFWTAK